ncbi:GntR family transcriptional regulator [Gulosibacter molinativorax]|uniref:GntR family transcriptional regulator n=1 Tax=Gulosibacter molinativorax TaxID=256821 RepID=A0ABT7CB44_9MICO|nr:GntR family transcriptional regulator [Gulosibacter molinativorax]MDJ1371982.1 GntR family transcriptional regulator [Gulosibacter molinativorax]QUY62654.1 Bacterial regulatory s, gntR family protein [Gulosibacter molinativorax]
MSSPRAAAAEPSKSQQAYNYLRERITSGAFGPGYRLVLGQIAQELGFSTVPVREAIRMLEAEGAVTFVHNVGAQVTMLNSDVYHETMETLSLVEGFATAKSAPNLTTEDLAQAREINAKMRALTESDTLDATEFTRLNQEFHTVLFQHCENSHVSDLVRRGWHRLETMRESSFAFVPGRSLESVDEHEALVELIESGASETEVEEKAREHRLNTMNAVLSSLEAKSSRSSQTSSPQPTK